MIKNFIKQNKETIILVLILLLASVARFTDLDSLPPGLYPDEALNVNQAIDEPFKIFYPDNFGREGLFLNILTVAFNLFGISMTTARAVPALFGVLTVLGIYLLGKELFNKNVGLVSAFFLALSFWHINFSRILFRAILVPFFLTFTFYFLLKGIRKNKTLLLVVAGISYGLGFYTYLAYRLSVLLLPLLLLFQRDKKKLLKQLVVFLATTFVVALPIGMYFLQHPSHFMARTGVSVFTQEGPILTFLSSLGTHILQFFINGDPNWRHNISGSPALFWPTAVLFFIGIVIAKKGVWKDDNRPVYVLLFSWILLMLLPGALTYEGIPHHLRTIGTIPPVFLLAGLGGWWVIEKSKNIFKSNPNNSYSVIVKLGGALLILSFTLASLLRYFDVWAYEDEVKAHFFHQSTGMVELLETLPQDITKVVIVPGNGNSQETLPLPTQSLIFLERAKYGESRLNYLYTNELDQIEPNAILIPLDFSPELLTRLQDIIPGFKVSRENDIFYITP